MLTSADRTDNVEDGQADDKVFHAKGRYGHAQLFNDFN
jgi:hypothetical protein